MATAGRPPPPSRRTGRGKNQCGKMGSVVGEVVEIDGSIMEGGGQILRMSVGSFKVRIGFSNPMEAFQVALFQLFAH